MRPSSDCPEGTPSADGLNGPHQQGRDAGKGASPVEPARVVTSQEPVIPYRSVLVVIDVQFGFDDRSWGSRNNPEAEEVCGAVLRTWRALGWPVIHIQHDSTDPCSPLFPGQRGHDLKPQVAPRPIEPVLHKRVNSAFIGTDLEARLHTLAAPGLVLCGLTTDHCVSTTARMAANLGFTTWVVADACATFARTGADGTQYLASLIHETTLASLHREFAHVITSGDLP